MTEEDTTNKIGKYFVWVAWIIAIGMLVFFFQGLLDTQQNPNSSPTSYLSDNGLNEVHLKRNKQGHYVTTGKINQQSVIFLLDTGATDVSIPEHIAENLNLPRYNKYQVSTANGNTYVYRSVINALKIGDITLYNVEANINPSFKSDEILLGMSALKQLELHQSGNTLKLREQN
ncbi:retropepsin-like aspartic protease family protein [Pseudocolwellia sp. HL-MZ19]|uniref:retropepsin-like aspartic protease family protein n=1 Tax=Pseudocolwellia sp. HL-MZ19 TaxID=3400846 RepID=UPI003CF32FE9